MGNAIIAFSIFKEVNLYLKSAPRAPRKPRRIARSKKLKAVEA